MSINDLMLAMRRLQKLPNDARVQRILQVLVEDDDGKIDVTDALKVSDCTLFFTHNRNSAASSVLWYSWR